MYTVSCVCFVFGTQHCRHWEIRLATDVVKSHLPYNRYVDENNDEFEVNERPWRVFGTFGLAPQIGIVGVDMLWKTEPSRGGQTRLVLMVRGKNNFIFGAKVNGKSLFWPIKIHIYDILGPFFRTARVMEVPIGLHVVGLSG